MGVGQDPIALRGGETRAVRFEPGIRLVGALLPQSARRGETISLTAWFRLDEGLREPFPEIFVHAVVPGGETAQAQADHPPPADPSGLRAGDLVEDTFSLHIPPTFDADSMRILIGWYRGDTRFRATPNEGKDRALLGVVPIVDGPLSIPEAIAHRTTAPLTIDGVLDEPAWQTAVRVGPFIAHHGRGIPARKTFARFLWDHAALYVAFEADDDDVHTPYTKRDDPLYESEAVELFIDADGDRDVYVELQAAPNDVHFDAAFRGGRRKGFDTSWDHPYETRTRIRGTLNNSDDVDDGFVSEWRVPFAGLRGVEAPPQVGTTWMVNLFRLERRRRGGKVVGTEASAWSSPHSNDFHNLDRFGRLRFLDVATAAAEATPKDERPAGRSSLKASP